MILVCDVDNVNVFFDKRQSDMKMEKGVSFIDCMSTLMRCCSMKSVSLDFGKPSLEFLRISLWTEGTCI